MFVHFVDGKSKNLMKFRRIGCLFCAVWFLCLCSCGLETFYFLDPPISDVELENPSDPAQRVFSFQSVSNSASSDIFVGTAVYYRLYNSQSTMNSNMATIENINDEYSDAAMNRMISFGFQPIALGNSELIVEKSEGVAKVKIRIFTEGTYKAEVLIDDDGKGVPLRFPLRKGFSFYPVEEETEEEFPVPKEGDEDTNYSSAGGEIWYILAYAVSVGRSMELTPVYSQVTPLGWLSVSPDNY